MSADDEPTIEPPREEFGAAAAELPEFDEKRRLLASVEELRALLAPLSDDDRTRVLDLARSLRRRPGSMS
jgi:hypothetical protein